MAEGQIEDERQQIEKCQRGDPHALSWLNGKYQPVLAKILRARGASVTETEDLLADLWADCVPGADERPSLLEKFNGKCALQSWLATVATRRWIDLKRKQARRGDVATRDDQELDEDPFARMAAAMSPEQESALVALLRESLQVGFSCCSPEAMVILRLVYLHALTQREVVRMLGCSEAKVSRTLSQAMSEIEFNTLRHLKTKDAWLELTWQDFLDLCETHQTGFF